MKRRWLSASIALLLLAAETDAAAQSVKDGARGPRFRFGAGLVSGLVVVTPALSGSIATLFGVGLRAGVQLDDRWAILYQASATFIWTQVRNAILFEWTPIDWFSVGAGPGVDVIVDVPNGGGGANRSWSIGVPLRFAFNVPVHRAPSGRRDAVSIGLDVTPASAFAIEGFPPTGFQLGLMGGISYEMY